jgi:hypothetical protein
MSAGDWWIALAMDRETCISLNAVAMKVWVRELFFNLLH